MDHETRAWLQEPIDKSLAIGIGVAWLVLVQIAMLLEPATHQPEPWFGVVLQLISTLLLATMVAGLVMQRRFGLVASLGGAVFATALSIACPVSGHHPFGAWWFGQMACVLALVGASVVALHWSTTEPPFTRRRAVSLPTPSDVSASDGASRG